MRRSWIFPFLIAGLLPVPALAESVAEQVPLGPRAIAMGGAFAAVADDGWTLYWNPAGLPWVGRQELLGSRARLYDSELVDGSAGVVVPIRRRHAAGLGWYHSGLAEGGLEFSENRFDAAYGFRIGEILSLGGSLHLLTRRVSDGGVEAEDGRGWGADVGLRVQATDALSIGLVGRDLFDTHLKSGDQASSLAYPRLLALGAACRLSDQVMATLEFDDRIHAGLEVTPMKPIALRAGLKDDPNDGLATAPTAGVGLTVGGLRVDYAWESHPVLGSTNHLGLALSLNLNPARVRIEKVEMEDLYASLYKSYESRPLGTVRIRNLRSEALRTRVQIFDRRLMDRPSEQEVILRPGATQDVRLTAVLSSRVMSVTEDRFVQLEVSASYESARLERTDRAVAPCLVYAPGALDWSRGVDQIQAFVTPRDTVVARLARTAALRVTAADIAAIGNSNLAQVSRVLEILASMGFTYVSDPIDSYASRVSQGPRVDTVQYPRESLASRTGDCDDTSVLIASILANIGIESRFVDVPGHLFVLVDTGLRDRDLAGLSMPATWSEVVDDRVWIPLETTRMTDGLAGAWEAGVATWSHWESLDRIQLVEPARGGGYEPASPVRNFPTLSIPAGGGTVTDRDARIIAQQRRTFLSSTYGPEPGWTASADTLVDVARIRFLSGLREEARELLETGLRLYPSPRLHNNLGAVQMSLDEAATALAQFDAALAGDPGDGGIWLNRGLALTVLGRHDEAIQATDRGIELLGSYSSACRILGVPVDEDPDREGGTRLTIETTRGLLQAAQLLRRFFPDSTSRPAGADQLPADSLAAPADSLAGRPQPKDQRWRTRTSPSLTPMMASARADDEIDLARILYWKP